LEKLQIYPKLMIMEKVNPLRQKPMSISTAKTTAKLENK
jgi:hypothetical protein